jgi:FKBP-type peptidyl-prolyl cis-trans isomerase
MRDTTENVLLAVLACTEDIIVTKTQTMAQQISEGVTKEILKEAQPNSPLPKKGQTITVHCTGKLDNGKKFWSTKDSGQKPFSFQVGLGKV